MLPSLKIGRLFGIPVYLHSTLILLPALVFLNTSGEGWPTMLLMLAITLTLFTCVLLHEFGHALMARWFGIVTRDVTLYPIGGVARLERMAERPAEEILIALAGPAVNVLIAALLTPIVFTFLFLGIGLFGAEGFTINLSEPASAWVAKFCFGLWGANIALVVFNLMPAFPMDGGRVLRAILAHFFGLLRGTEIAVPIGIGVVFLFAFLMTGVPMLISLVATGKLVVGNPMPLVIAAFISLIGPMELRALRHREQQKREGHMVEDHPVPIEPPSAMPQLRPGFSGYTWDGEFGVWVKWQDGHRVAAYWNGPE
jgi:Zn-dependent protease